MTRANTISAIAEDARRHFATKQGTEERGTFWVAGLPGNPDAEAPEWITDMIYDAHGDMFPDDVIYEAVVDALDAITEADGDAEEDDIRHEFADGVSVYNAPRLRWLASHGTRYALVDEAAEDFGSGAWPKGGIIEAIGWGMYRERENVFGAVWAALVERAEEIEDEDEPEAAEGDED